ncbi:MAG: hypothetical protein ACHQ7N_17585 [Candidatus Methylomirabilales bacterium]
MVSPSPEPVEPFESWLLRRVAQAVEAGEVPATLLADLQAEIEAARERPQEEGYAEAVRDIAQRLDVPLEQAASMLTGLESQPTLTREVFLRRIVEAWLEGQRKVYRRGS